MIDLHLNSDGTGAVVHLAHDHIVAVYTAAGVTQVETITGRIWSVREPQFDVNRMIRDARYDDRFTLADAISTATMLNR